MDISPDKQNINTVFSNTRFHIDFYQRDYKWGKEPVLRLLDDIFFKFEETYKLHSSLPASPEIINSKYPWYYLNTYVTNSVDGKVFIVDGQQRLTTLSLILIKLLHLGTAHSSSLVKWIDSKIAGQSGYESEFWLNHEGHKKTQNSLYKNEIEKIDTSSGVTAQNMHKNYIEINKFLDKSLDTKEKFETFVFYFLNRLVLINLSVEQTDVPMVFEVINDRGVKLKPFEIMKGKLLGQIDKDLLKTKKYNELWEENISKINSFEDDEADEFFRIYLKAKYANSRKEGTAFDGDYHRTVFSHDFQEKLKLAHNQDGVIKFLDGAFTYYSSLYIKALEKFDPEAGTAFSLNYLNDIDGGFLLLMSSCEENDPEENEKIELLPAELDRAFSLLQLQNSYDSNTFQEMIYKISSEIRGSKISKIRPAFDKFIIEEISKQRMSETDVAFKYIFFKNAGIGLNTRFKRYFFARIEEFLAKGMNLNMKHTLSELVLKTGVKTGFHIEHILAHNDENLTLFEGDEDKFEQERNRLGAILLLKGKDNISSNNEVYAEKLKSYANTLYWNETLREDSYKSKLDMKKLKAEYGLELEPINTFGLKEIEDRQALLFKIASIIWS